MVELDFRKATTKEDVEKVFNDKERELEKEIKDLRKLRELFFEEVA